MERSGVHIFICGNDAKEELADWLIAKKRMSVMIFSGANQMWSRSHFLNGSSTSN